MSFVHQLLVKLNYTVIKHLVIHSLLLFLLFIY